VEFVQALKKLHTEYPNLVFLTGDLGFMALEDIRDALGERFVNAGVAEQNMISVAAGLAYKGLLPVVYSIAPFAVLRPFEQIRNDVCLHSLPVKIVGNGGGYGYGIMGATHHTLEDIGILRSLPSMKVYVPLVTTDVEESVRLMLDDSSPAYLRLNLAAKLPASIPPFQSWRRIHAPSAEQRCVIIGTGPVLSNLFDAGNEEFLPHCEVWSAGTFPLAAPPAEMLASIDQTARVLTIEEHVSNGGLCEAFARILLSLGIRPSAYRSLTAQGYPSGRYGSQRWHQEESGLAGTKLCTALAEMTII
jgi:transketolase